MKRPWWRRWLRPNVSERQTAETLSEVRRALARLDRALATVEYAKRRRWPDDAR